MRLIDKDALIEEIKRTTFVTCELDNVFEAIENAPTIESRPKGEWVQSDQDKLLSKIKCSVCNRAIYLSEYYNYCPNCGADMRGEE